MFQRSGDFTDALKWVTLPSTEEIEEAVHRARVDAL
jgi:hypothetical protein